jgi:hypothetical protein
MRKKVPFLPLSKEKILAGEGAEGEVQPGSKRARTASYDPTAAQRRSRRRSWPGQRNAARCLEPSEDDDSDPEAAAEEAEW